MTNNKNSADVYLWNKRAGVLKRTSTGYSFTYDKEYLALPDAQPVSLTLPLKDTPYESNSLFPFFLGLIPEGWLLDIISRTLKIDPENTFEILLSTCQDCIGAVKIIPTSQREPK